MTAEQVVINNNNPTRHHLSWRWTMGYSYGMNKLHSACNRNDLAKVSTLLSSRTIGLLKKHKKRIIMIVTERDSDERTPLHYAVTNSDISVEIISKLIEIGGRDLVLSRDLYGENAVHVAISSNVSVEIISELVKAGGREALFAKDNQGETLLHKCTAENTDVSIGTLSKLIEVGGMSLLAEKDNKGRTVLHKALSNKNASVEVVLKLIEAGGKDLLMEKDNKGRTALHNHLKSAGNVSIAVVSAFLESGGNEIITQKDDSGKIALHYHIGNYSFFEGLSEGAVRILLRAGIDSNIGGEFGIGGLFVPLSCEKVQDEIYDVWEEISPTVAKVVSSLGDSGRLPILQAAIIARASPSQLRDILMRFDCITVKDSMNRYPIDIALESKMKWRDGMKDIIEAMAVKQSRSVVHVAAHYGLQWRNHMKKLLKSSFKDVMKNNEEQDPMTGLSLFMLCAEGKKSNLNSIYMSLRYQSSQDTFKLKNASDRNIAHNQQ